jgi:hypothetical protein
MNCGRWHGATKEPKPTATSRGFFAFFCGTAQVPPSALRDAHFRTMIKQLKTIPGISELGACTILAEIGRDISRFRTDAHLMSWAGLCPRNDESAGKRRSSRIRKGAPQSASSPNWAALATPLI